MINIFLTSSFVSPSGAVFDLIDRSKFKNVLFITTAAELETGEKKWLKEEQQTFTNAGFDVARYTLTSANPDRLREDVSYADIIFVAGGNPFYLLHQIHKTGFGDMVKDHIAIGKIYIGQSSGMIVAAPDIEVAYRPEAMGQVPQLESYKGIGLVDFVGFPHWGSEMAKETYLKHRINKAYREDYKIVLLTDSQFIAVRNDGWYKVIDINDQ